jgi:transcriptional regulator with GAF, ATPase, and Fis domain
MGGGGAHSAEPPGPEAEYGAGAARALGISRNTLWRKMKKYGIAVAE